MKFGRLAVLFSVVLLFGAASAATAQKKKGAGKPPPPPPPACGMTWFPLQAGNSWTWKSGDLQVSLRVVAVTDGGKDEAGLAITKIDVEEDNPGGQVKTAWTCTEKGLQIDPQSFAFAGEGGVMFGMTFAITKREGLEGAPPISLAPDASFVKDSGWQEKIFIDVTRADTGGHGAELPPAKLELQKSVIVRGDEEVNSPVIGGLAQTLHLTFDLRAKVRYEGLDKPSELPVKRFGDKAPGIWMIKGVGIVRIQDSYDKDWYLTATSLTLPAPLPAPAEPAPTPTPAPPK